MSVIKTNAPKEKLADSKHNIGSFTPEDVLKLNKFTEQFLCPQKANIFDIDFIRFQIRDLESKKTLFEIEKPQCGGQTNFPLPEQSEEENLDSGKRYIRYTFPSEFLNLKTVGTTVNFNFIKS